jgi:hypothetical protein
MTLMGAIDPIASQRSVVLGCIPGMEIPRAAAEMA